VKPGSYLQCVCVCVCVCERERGECERLTLVWLIDYDRAIFY